MSQIDSLNKEQKEAVLQTQGPLLILAGAGSGKTKTVTQKIAYLIQEKGVSPYEILAFTFTNKAAKEMKDRVEALLDASVQGLWIGTFHAICVRILRRYHDRLGFDSQFSIYDRSDQLRAVKETVKEMNLAKDMFKEKSILAAINNYKNQGIMARDLGPQASGNFYEERVIEIYRAYQKKLRENNAMDFDDILLYTVQLLKEDQEVRTYYQFHFNYIFVDEYQDTNATQYQLIQLLCQPDPNLTVVGDNDQSIYAWRGADISNILNFEKDFPQAKVILLEQNYRSTKNILSIANKVISNNPKRRDKKLWTDLEEGHLVEYREYSHSQEENKDVVNQIIQRHNKGHSFSDMAILYRTNAQSRGFEEYLIQEGIPYKVVGGLKFYDRKEVKDVLAYMTLLANPQDDLSLARVVNVPKRGIGESTLDQLRVLAGQENKSIFQVMEDLVEDGQTKIRAKKNIEKFVQLVHLLQEKAKDLTISEIMEAVIYESQYLDSLKEENTLEARNRMDNIQELVTAGQNYEKENPEDSLEAFLTSLSLLSDVDKTDESQGSVQLMTVHAAKGLEFRLVFLVGMEERVFPSAMSLEEDEANVEEERRLCYVAITRAKKELYISSARNRTMYGKTVMNMPSRFIDEMGQDLHRVQAYNSYGASQEVSAGRSDYLQVSKYKGEGASYQKGPKQDPAYQSKTKEDIRIGSKVRHKKFGQGMVVSLQAKGQDTEVVISFEGKGLKKLLLSFAPIEVVKS